MTVVMKAAFDEIRRQLDQEREKHRQDTADLEQQLEIVTKKLKAAEELTKAAIKLEKSWKIKLDAAPPATPLERQRKVQLNHSPSDKRWIALVGDINGNHNSSPIKSGMYELVLPFDMVLFGHKSKTLWVNLHGYVSHGERLEYAEPLKLPSPDIGFSRVLCPYWDHDHFEIAKGTAQGIYYLVFGNGTARILYLQWHVSKGDVNYHFGISYQENVPDMVRFRYLSVPERGMHAMIGAQGTPQGQVYHSVIPKFNYWKVQFTMLPFKEWSIQTSKADVHEVHFDRVQELGRVSHEYATYVK